MPVVDLGSIRQAFSNLRDDVEDGIEELTAYWQGQYDDLIAEIREDRATLEALNAKRDVLVDYKEFLESYRDTIDLPGGFEDLANALTVSRGVFVTEMAETLITNYDVDSLYSRAGVFRDSLAALIDTVSADIINLDCDIATIVLGLDDLGTSVQSIISTAASLGVPLVLVAL